jgi:hypothetical protein
MNRLQILGLILLVLWYTNPEPDLFPRIGYQLKNFYIASILKVPHMLYPADYYLGILGNWIDISAIVALIPKGKTFNCKRCLNGICLFGECFCFTGWKSRHCNVKVVGFKSIWELAFPFLRKAWPESPILFAYDYSDCFLGIPTNYLSTKTVLILEQWNLINLGMKLNALDLFILLSFVGFVFCQLDRFRLLNLNMGKFMLTTGSIVRINYSIFTCYFVNNGILSFVYSMIGFYSNAPIAQSYLGNELFLLYMLAVLFLTSIARIIFGKSTGAYWEYSGAGSVTTALKFLCYTFASDKQAYLTNELLPHIGFVFLGDGFVDVPSIFVSYVLALAFGVFQIQ